MNPFRLWTLIALVGFALPMSCPALSDPLILALERAFEPIHARVGPDLTGVASMGPVECELWHRGVESTPDKKPLGPTPRGFVFRARRLGDPASFKPDQPPFDWAGYPKQAEHTWVSEFHLVPIYGDDWLCISVWRGPDADQELIRELLDTAAKSAEGQRTAGQR